MEHKPNHPQESSDRPPIEVTNIINEVSPSPAPPSSLNGRSQNGAPGLLKQLGSLFWNLVSESKKTETSPLPSLKTEAMSPGRRLSFLRLFVVVLIILGVGVGYYILPHPASSPAKVDLIRHATIETAYVKSDPSPFLGQPIFARGLYFCDVSYPVSGNSSFKEVLKDVDEGAKNNSADVFQLCNEYSQSTHLSLSGHLVTLIVSGYRDPATSSFRNILQVIPE